MTDCHKKTIDIIIMCIQIAKGLEFLSNNNYVHRDIAARNCLGVCMCVCL